MRTTGGVRAAMAVVDERRSEAQGTGLGSRLIEHGHRRADVAGLPCYLETFTERNVAYYRRRGWAVVETYRVAGDVPVYALLRPPSG